MKVLIYLCLLALLGCGAYLALVPAKANTEAIVDISPKPGSMAYPKPFWGHYISDKAANLDSIGNCVTLTPKSRKEFSENIEERWKVIRITPNSFQENSEAYREVMDFSIVSANSRTVVIEGLKAKAERSIRNTVRATITLDPKDISIEFDAAPGLHMRYIRDR